MPTWVVIFKNMVDGFLVGLSLYIAYMILLSDYSKFWLICPMVGAIMYYREYQIRMQLDDLLIAIQNTE